MSTKSAGLAAQMGYNNIKVLLKGAPGWKKSGQNLVASHEFVNTGNIVLIDLRPRPEAFKSHILRAVNIPISDLEDAEDDFPSNTSAPIVLYGNGDDPIKAAKILMGWGFKKTAMVDGGIEGYARAGNTLSTNHQPLTKIQWVRKLEPGEISLAEFNKALESHAYNQILLDVRGRDEVAAGKLTGTVAIPLDELEARMGELPKDKEILIHCSTGARAEMAHEALQKAGFTSRFLVANVECEDNQCEVSE